MKSGANINNLKNYQEMTNTLDLLYKLGVLGELDYSNGEYYLILYKKELLNYTKRSLNRSIDYLLNYGFEFRYYNNKEETILSKASSIIVYFNDNSKLLKEINEIAKKISILSLKCDHMYNRFLFYTNRINPFSDNELLDLSIKNLLDTDFINWIKIVNYFEYIDNFTYEIDVQPNVSPFYKVAFYIRKKRVALFRIQYEQLIMFVPNNTNSKTTRFTGCGNSLGNDVTLINRQSVN